MKLCRAPSRNRNMLGDATTSWLRNDQTLRKPVFHCWPSFIHLLYSVSWSLLVPIKKEQTPRWFGYSNVQNGCTLFPVICLTKMFSQGICETPDFLLHTSLYLLLKRGAARKIHILANACSVLICPNRCLADIKMIVYVFIYLSK